MNFLSIGFWAAFCAFFLIYIFMKRWSRTAMLLWVIAFDLFFFWQANGWLMLLLPATAAINFFLTELLRRAGASAQRTGVPASRLPSSLSAPAETGFGATNPAAAELSPSGNTGAAFFLSVRRDFSRSWT